MCADFYCGPKRIRRFFETEALAKAYEARELTSINDTGKLTKNKNLSRFLVRQIAEEYRDEEAPKHKGAKFEMSRIRTILKHEICKRTLAIVNKYDAGKYQQDRLATGISPPSVRREIGALVFVFSHAMTKEQYDGLTNPFSGIVVKGSKVRRQRRLDDDYEHETERIEKACDACRGWQNQYYLKLAFTLAIETAMRRAK